MSNTNPRWPTRRVLASLLLAAFGVAALAGSALAASLVKNGSFEKDSNGDGIPNNWLGNFNFTPADKRVCNQSHAGTCSFRLVGDGNNKFLSQELAISGIDGDQAIFGIPFVCERGARDRGGADLVEGIETGGVV